MTNIKYYPEHPSCRDENGELKPFSDYLQERLRFYMIGAYSSNGEATYYEEYLFTVPGVRSFWNRILKSMPEEGKIYHVTGFDQDF